MNISKSTSYVFLHLLNGAATSVEINQHLPDIDIRSIQRALARLADIGAVIKEGSNNNPTYSPNYHTIINTAITDKLLEDENRPQSIFRHAFIAWLNSLPVQQLDALFGEYNKVIDSATDGKMSAKELEHLTIELSWKSSALEGNTYTLLDTQLLLIEGIKAKNRTEFETQMILNHKDAIAFIVENPELFTDNIAFSSVEELHRIIGHNLGIDAGIRKKIVRISASNYEPLANPHLLRENMDIILAIVSRSQSPFVRAQLALTLIPYLQAFEDGNKRTGRMLANAMLMSSVGKGFSLRKTDARKLALAYLAFYEFNSMTTLAKILKTELQ